MAQRINAGQLMVMLGAAALLVSLFLDWYDPDLSAWEIFEIADIVLAGLAIVALATALPMRLPGELGDTTARLDRRLPVIGLAALAFVIVTLINTPPAASELELEFGAWLGLIGAALMAAGGFLSTSRISIVVSSRPPGEGERATTPADRVERDSTSATRPLEDEPPPPPPPPPPAR
jgi:peptidoglycan/LPS O-acetylase OafA/YrhL